MKYWIISIVCLSFLYSQEKQITYSEIFPQNTLAVVSLSDVNQAKKDFEKTNLYAFLQDPEIKRIVDILTKNQGKSWEDFSQKLKTAIDLTLGEAFSVFAGEVSIALIDVPSGSSPVEVGVIINYRDKKNEAHALVKALTERLPVEKGNYTIENHKISYLKGLETALHYTEVQDSFLLATTTNLMQQMLKNITEEGNSLKNTPKFQKMSASLKDTALSYYFDVEKFVDIVENSLNIHDRAFLSCSGIADWKAIAISFSMKEKQFLSQFNCHYTGNRGFNNFAFFQPIAKNIAAEISKESGGFVASSVEWHKLWQAFLNAFAHYEEFIQQQFPKQTPYTDFRDQITKFERAFLEMSFSDALFSIGPDCALFHFPDPSGGIIPKWVLTANTKDSEKLQKFLNVITEVIGYEFKEKKYNGNSLYYLSRKPSKSNLVQVSRQDRQFLSFLLGKFAYCIIDDKIFFMRTTQGLMDFIDAQGNIPFDLQQWPQANILTYVNWEKFFPTIYSSILPLIPIFEQQFPHFFQQLQIRSVDLPRTSTIMKYILPVVAQMQTQKEEVSISLHSNFNLDFFLAQGGLWLSLEDAWGPVIGKFIKELYAHLTVNQKVTDLVKDEKFYEAYLQWENAEKTAYFESFRLIAENEKNKQNAKYTQQIKQLKNGLKQKYSGELNTWRINGDWKHEDGVISASNTSSKEFYMIAGENALEDYIFQLEVKDVKNSFWLAFHWNQDFYERPNYKAVKLRGNGKQKGQWIPLKFKIHKNRISYWYGLKHYVVKAAQTSGLIGIYLPQNSKIQMRNMRLTVKNKVVPKFKQPVILIQSNDSADPVFVKQNVDYSFTVKNEGNKQATGVTLSVSLPQGSKFVSATGAKYTTDKNKIIFSPVVVQPNKTLQCKLQVSMEKPGSKIAIAAITFNELQGKIVVTERTHVLPESIEIPKNEDDDIEWDNSDDWDE